MNLDRDEIGDHGKGGGAECERVSREFWETDDGTEVGVEGCLAS